jgi:hypothetical protein
MFESSNKLHKKKKQNYLNFHQNLNPKPKPKGQKGMNKESFTISS